MAYTTHNGHVAAGAATGPTETLGRVIAGAVRRFRRYREFEQAEIQLNAMSDRGLADIGISRGEIHDRVWAGY